MKSTIQQPGGPVQRGKAFADLRQSLGMTQAEAAAAIAAKTMRPCALRTVQAWEAQPDQKSARPCPEWAILILEALQREAVDQSR